MRKLLITVLSAAAILVAPLAASANTTGNTTTEHTVNDHQVRSLYQLNMNRYFNWQIWMELCPVLKDQVLPNLQPKPEQPKPEQPKPEQPKPEQPKPEQPKPEQPKPEQPKPQQPKPEQPKPGQQSGQLSAYEQQVVDLTNAERSKNGLSPLKVDTELSKVAREKSRDMSANKYFDHNSPTYGSPFDMMKKFGISYRSAGENIAMGQRTPQEVVKAWMNSPGHRANILNSSYTHIGVGHVENGNYWTQQFIGK